MDFKKALVISFVSHCLVLSPLGSIGIFHPLKKTDEIQITYFQIKPVKIESPSTKPAPVVKEEKQEPSKKEGVFPKKQKLDIVKKRARAPQIKPQALNTPLSKENIIPESIPGTTLPNTPQCVTYYNYIREEIRRELERNYKPEHEEGEVGVSFGINQTGKLIELGIRDERSSKDVVLRRLAYESIKNTSPFKSFPKGLTMEQISFNLTVVFKKK